MSKGRKGARRQFVVIGCGSALRGDDAAGLRVAERLSRWRRSNLRALPVHQLAPELAEDLAACDVAVFVDAYAARPRDALRVERVAPTSTCARPAAGMAHVGNPCQILQFTQATYGRHPEAWVVGIPAACFDLGEAISRPTLRHMREAEAVIRRLIDAEGPTAGRRIPRRRAPREIHAHA